MREKKVYSHSKKVYYVLLFKAFYYCAAGACLAMCFRYASTCDNSVFRTISWFYETIQENNTSNIYLRLTEKAGRNCLNSCTNIVSICFGMVRSSSSSFLDI